MNTKHLPDSASDDAWSTPDDALQMSDTPQALLGEEAAAPAVELLKQAVQGAHDTIDRLAERATPAVEQMGERAAAAEDAWHASTEHLRETRDEWVEGARTSVRGSPLLAVAAALTLGLVIARISR